MHVSVRILITDDLISAFFANVNVKQAMEGVLCGRLKSLQRLIVQEGSSLDIEVVNDVTCNTNFISDTDYRVGLTGRWKILPDKGIVL